MILQDRGKEYIVPIDYKAIQIYDKTKNRRIKKKQLKKTHLIEIRNEIIKTIGNVKKVKVYIDGKEIIKEDKKWVKL